MSDLTQEPREIRIPARLDQVSMVRRMVREVAHQVGVAPDQVSNLLLAVSEACNNAIQHGARHVPNAQITVRIVTEPEAIHVEVRDPGKGFDPGALWEPRSETPRGRGLLMMIQLTDKVEYWIDQHGTVVTLTHQKSRPAPDAALAEGAASFTSRRRSQLYCLFEVCRAVSSTLDLSEVLQVVAESTGRLFGVCRARVLLHDSQQQMPVVAASWEDEMKGSPSGEGQASPRQAVYLAGQEGSPARDSDDARGNGASVRSSISVPIISRGEAVGSIHLDCFDQPRKFSRTDVMALWAIAAQAAVAIENARLHREVQRHVEELAALSEVARLLNASLDLDRVLQTILEKTRELLGVEVCSVMLLDAEGYLSVRASCGMSREYAEHQRVLLSETPLARALSERRVIAAWDLRTYDLPRGLNEGIVSAAAAPMILGDQPVGTLNIYTRERYRFTPEQLRLLRALADHTALAIHNARLYEKSQQAREQLEASLGRTVPALKGAQGLQDVFRLVASLAAEALGMEGGALVLHDQGVLIGVAMPPLGGEHQEALGAFDQLVQLVVSLQRPVTLQDLAQHAAGHALRAAGVAACLAVPMGFQTEARGALCVYSRVPRSFSAREIALLNSFAAQAAIVVENQRLLEETQLRLEELQTLLEIGQSIVSKLDLDSVLRRIIENVCRLTEAEVCSILLLDPATGELYVAASHGLDVRHARRLRIAPGEGIIGTVLRDGAPCAVTDIRRHPDYTYQDVSETQGLRAFLCVPLKAGADTLGVLNVYRTVAHTWSDAEVKFLGALGTQAAIAIQNATLYQQERQVARALQQAFVPQRPPSVPGAEIGRIYVPAGEQEEVGGDFYDFIPLDRDRLGIVIADVSGKGLRAATATAMGKYILRAYLLENPMPGEVVRRTNNALWAQLQDEAAFLTLVYALWEPRTRHLTYVNAGHPYPLLWQSATGRCVALHSPQTLLLGILPNQTFSERRLILQPGDVLLAYTDGVTDSRRDGEPFGLVRLQEAFLEVIDQPAQEICDALYQRVCAWRGDSPSSDDTTIVVIRFGG